VNIFSKDTITVSLAIVVAACSRAPPRDAAVIDAAPIDAVSEDRVMDGAIADAAGDAPSMDAALVDAASLPIPSRAKSCKPSEYCIVETILGGKGTTPGPDEQCEPCSSHTNVRCSPRPPESMTGCQRTAPRSYKCATAAP
jgi:hypothetical protein